ncbi:methanol dehydrogenase [Pedobacter psychrophilus]|uniref:Methanol dehydrogenase n=1 Tax=Pedobacter psychrophilus TaxID=1826909 RepID=A0A179DDW4_9SPHI|nr:TPM domain-containing protein [Pedobacter psychrophilus]OAQ39158.1 methanol dehydrogenase [Pedobacter psychrophilus]
MKKIFLIVCLGLLSFLGFSQNFPAKPNKLVNDYTNTLNSSQIADLESKLVAFDDSTSIQVSVVLIQSLEGYDIQDYGYQLGRAWGIGGKEKNTGVLVLASIGDRKITIQTGYGMEGALPDAIAKRIIENEIKPEFKSGNYFGGLDAGINAIISYTKGEYKNTEPKKSGKGSGFPVGLIVLIIIAVIALISKGSGGGGGGRNVIGGRGGANIFWWSLLAGMANSGGGRSGGGGFGGGSSGGGGFGGFGGGSFGGGGASGSW